MATANEIKKKIVDHEYLVRCPICDQLIKLVVSWMVFPDSDKNVEIDRIMTPDHWIEFCNPKVREPHPFRGLCPGSGLAVMR
jgi:hypothetical protein